MKKVSVSGGAAITVGDAPGPWHSASSGTDDTKHSLEKAGSSKPLILRDNPDFEDRQRIIFSGKRWKDSRLEKGQSPNRALPPIVGLSAGSPKIGFAPWLWLGLLWVWLACHLAPSDSKGLAASTFGFRLTLFGFAFGHFSHRSVDSKGPVGFASSK